MTITDTKGRSIEIKGDFDVEAFHEGKCIGRIEFDEADDGPFLWAMNVDGDYQQAGIGTEMMRLAAELHGKWLGKPSHLATGGSQAAAHTYYSQEGAALIARCIRLGILEDSEPRDPDDEMRTE
jgi:GNAT superfamily N-acetyltransferase